MRERWEALHGSESATFLGILLKLQVSNPFSFDVQTWVVCYHCRFAVKFSPLVVFLGSVIGKP